jgi:hypothetical protein
MKKIIAIILVIFLFACKNDVEKTDALDFCLENSIDLIRLENINIIKGFEHRLLNQINYSDTILKFEISQANKAFKLYDEFNKKLLITVDENKISNQVLSLAFKEYLDTLLIYSGPFKGNMLFEIEKCRKLKVNDSKVYSLLSTIILNKFLHALKQMILYDNFIFLQSQIIIVPTKDNYKIGDDLQVFFSEVYNKKRPEFNFTQFTRNGIPLNLKDLNYDKERRMIDFKIKEKGLYKIKGFEVTKMSMYDDDEKKTVRFPFEAEYEVK